MLDIKNNISNMWLVNRKSVITNSDLASIQVKIQDNWFIMDRGLYKFNMKMNGKKNNSR